MQILKDESILEQSRDGSVSLLFFTAGWNGTCSVQERIVEALLLERGSKIKAFKITEEAHSHLFTRFGISSTPAVLLIKDSAIRECIEGVVTRDELDGKLNEILSE